MSTVSSSSSSTTTSTSLSTSNSVASSDYLSFDTASLVEAKLSPYYTRLDSYNSEVTENETKISAYEDLQDLLLEFQNYLEELRSDPSSSGKEDDVFLAREAYLTTSDGTSASTYMAATVDSGTDIATHTITISQIAKANILASETVSSRTDELGWTGTISVGTDAGTSADIAITDTMSLGDIADSINAESDNTGVTASIMKQSDSEYILVLTTDNTGETITLSDVSGSLMSDSSYFGYLDTSGDVESENILQAAQDAILSVDGVTITRDTNDIDDVLDGVTMHLYGVTDATLTLEVDNDLSSVKEAISNLVTAYNSFREVVLANQETNSDGTASDSATLWGDNILRSISTLLQTTLSSSVEEGTGGLSSIGITFDEDNNLVLDEDTLDDALLDDFDTIQSLFAYSMTTSSGDLTLVRAPDDSLEFDLDITVDSDGTLTGVTVDGDSSMFTVTSSGVIKGVEGTDYEGLTLLYTGKTSKTISVELTQGLADQMYYDVDTVANEDDGSITTAIDALEDTNSGLEDKISALEDTISTYADSLYTLYGNIAAKLAEADTTVSLLKALLSADSSS